MTGGAYRRLRDELAEFKERIRTVKNLHLGILTSCDLEAKDGGAEQFIIVTRALKVGGLRV